MNPCYICGASRIDLTCDSHADTGEAQAVAAAHYIQLARRSTAAGSMFYGCPNQWGDRSILHWLGTYRQRETWPITRAGGGCARVVIPTYQQQGVLRKAVRGPATCSGLRKRRQLIRGGRAQERAKQRPRGTCAVSTTVRFAYGLRFLIDADVDPDGFQHHLAMSTTVDICTPTPFRRCGKSWSRLASV